jgi:hypothetical protein
LKPTLDEKKQAAENGKLSRLTFDQIEETQTLLGGNKPGSARGNKKGFTPSGSQVNPKLKKALMI